MYSIEVNNLTKKFGSFTSVDNISFKVGEGEVYGFLGANGAGKSTTIKMLTGILEPTSGDAIVSGFSIKSHPDSVKMNIGYMSQKFSLYNDLTVEQNIDFFSGIYGISGNTLEQRKKWILNISGLEGKEGILTGSLPGGIKQRLALGTAVVHKPRVVFLDEPTSGVDPISRRRFWDLIFSLSDEGITVLVTTHYLEEAEYCNTILMIDAGKLVAEGVPKALKSQYIRNDIFEIQCTPLIEAMDHLSKAPFTGEISIFGNKIHLMSKSPAVNTSEITGYCAQSGINIIKLERITPSLEDLFIYLLDKRNRTK
ncbi:MAG: ABC transporter ATP-binding protein [Ignavibacteriaceae bacterium]|nr:ABC transporter ATP-binding protein [Ignavibacteriaceae bacterium]